MRVPTGRLLCLLAVVALPLLLVACGDGDETLTPIPEPTATPDAQATIEALAQAPAIGTPTPTTVPPENRAVVLNFATGHDHVTRDWEQFHADFDEWREGLTECDASSRQVDLRGFAGRFAGITEIAGRLPRAPSVRALADKLIDAAQRERGAIRLLRDNWQPGDPAVFEDVDVARSTALALRKDVEDELADLQGSTAPSSRILITSHSLAIRELNADWDVFHKKYDDFRAQEADLTSSETVERLSALIGEFRQNVIEEIRLLPASEVTQPVSTIIATLAQAATEEDLALRRLRDTFQKMGTDPEDVTFTPRDSSLFDAFNAQVVKSNTMRLQAAQDLASVLENVSEENQTVVEQFAKERDLLIAAWNDFHEDYDRWRQDDGGCDRRQAISALGGFTLRFAELASRTRMLPSASFLRPLRELLVEAVEREEQALRTLRNTWRPFEAEIYRSLDKERNTVGRLRRQVATGIQDLLPRYDLSPEDLAR